MSSSSSSSSDESDDGNIGNLEEQRRHNSRAERNDKDFDDDDDDSDVDSDDDQDEEEMNNNINQNKMKYNKKKLSERASSYYDHSDSEQERDQYESDDDSDDDNDDDDESDDEPSESENDDDDDDDINLSLSERIKKQDERGLAKTMSTIRGRKSAAMQKATERLAQYKKEKNQSNNKNSNKDNDKSNATTKKKNKKSKSAPTEMSSKRHDFFRNLKQTQHHINGAIDIQSNRYKPNDPRLSSLSGHYNQEHFERNYSFLYDMRKKEIDALKQRIHALKTPGKKGRKLRTQLKIKSTHTLEQDEEHLAQLQAEQTQLERMQLETTVKKSVQKKVKENKDKHGGIYHVKRKDRKRMELEAKFEVLAQRGKRGQDVIDKLVAKRRRKNKSRDATKFGA